MAEEVKILPRTISRADKGFGFAGLTATRKVIPTAHKNQMLKDWSRDKYTGTSYQVIL